MFGFLVEALFPHVSTIAIGGTRHLEQICRADEVTYSIPSCNRYACIPSGWGSVSPYRANLRLVDQVSWFVTVGVLGTSIILLPTSLVQLYVGQNYSSP